MPASNTESKSPRARPSTQGIHNFDLSSDFWDRSRGIQNTGFAGIHGEIRPSKDWATTISMSAPTRRWPTSSSWRNLKIHHNYLHEIGGEGIYCGNSFYNGANVYCPARIQYPHEVRDVEIWDNIFVSCSWESIQVGSGVQGNTDTR